MAECLFHLSSGYGHPLSAEDGLFALSHGYMTTIGPTVHAAVLSTVLYVLTA